MTTEVNEVDHPGASLSAAAAAEQQEQQNEQQNLDTAFTGEDELDEEEGSLPPPPPPSDPPPPHVINGSDSILQKKKNNKRKKKKKIGILLIGLTLIGAAIGLGLGFGLQNKNDNASNSSDAVDNDANEANSGGEVSGTKDDVDVGGWGGGWEEEEDDDEDGGEEVVEEYDVSTTTTTTTTVAPDAIIIEEGEEINIETTVAPDVTEQEEEEDQIYDAIIIGAGWSGIRAAQALVESNVTNFIVLESANYIGGRSRTRNADGSTNNPALIGDTTNIPYEMGSEWLYANGDQETVLKDEGYLPQELLDGDKDSVNLFPATWYQQTRDVDSGEVITKKLDDSDEWMDEIWYNGFLQFRENRLDELEGKTYEEAIDEYIDRWNWDDDEALQFINKMEDSIGLDYTGDSSQLGVTELEFFPEGYSVSAHYMSIPGVGFGNTAAKYAEPYAEYVKLNSNVVEVNSEGEELIEVTYVDKDDDGMTKSIKAKTVLITVSLGVLKAGTINFVPSLPANKQASIDNTGFGLNNKAVMTWKNKEDMIWPEDEFWFKLITPDDETSGLWTTFYNPSKFKGEPSLIAWVGGDEAWVEEERTNDEIMKDVIKNLRAMFPGIRNPDTALISRWGMNENVRGLYSFPKPGRDFNDDLDTLGERFGNIWFAGEATGSGRGTTMGAWNTGKEAGEDMAEKLKSM